MVYKFSIILLALFQLSVSGCPSIEEVLSRLEDFEKSLPKRTDASRQLQDIDGDCAQLLQQYPWPSCTCGEDPDSPGDAAVNCPGFCQICLSQADVCSTSSFFARHRDKVLILVRSTSVQTGTDSSQTTLVIEQDYFGFVPVSCRTYVGDTQCDQCTVNRDPNCAGGGAFDCSNIGLTPIDLCNATTLTGIGVANPFVTQVRNDLFNQALCVPVPVTPTIAPVDPSTSSPAPTFFIIPEKKQVPNDSKDDAVKLFRDDFAMIQGGITRKLRIRGA